MYIFINNISITQLLCSDICVVFADSDVFEVGVSDEPHPTGIVLRRVGYFTIPTMDQLANLMEQEGRCVVDNFTVGRYNYGNIFFPDSFDVCGLNLDEIGNYLKRLLFV